MDWLIAISHPKQEKYAASQLENQGCETYVPMCWRDAPHRGRIVSRKQAQQIVPLLSAYFVFKTNGLPVRTVLSTRGIRSIVKQSDGSPATMRQSEYERWVEMTSAVQDFRKTAAEYVIGQQLKIEKGPFAGLMGNLLEVSSGKLKIDVDLMGRSVNLVVAKADVSVSAA